MNHSAVNKWTRNRRNEVYTGIGLFNLLADYIAETGRLPSARIRSQINIGKVPVKISTINEALKNGAVIDLIEIPRLRELAKHIKLDSINTIHIFMLASGLATLDEKKEKLIPASPLPASIYQI